MSTELVHQMRNLGAKALLVEPAFLDTALEAASQAGLPWDHIFQFSDAAALAPTRSGIEDWRNMIGTPAQGDAYQWPRLTAQEAKTTVATVNFSSVRTVALPPVFFFLCLAVWGGGALCSDSPMGLPVRQVGDSCD